MREMYVCVRARVRARSKIRGYYYYNNIIHLCDGIGTMNGRFLPTCRSHTGHNNDIIILLYAPDTHR